MKNKKVLLSSVMLFILTFLMGCTSVPSPVRVTIDSYSDIIPGVEKSYYLEQPPAGRGEMELATRNYAIDLDLMLYKQGYRKVFDKKQANYIISFDCSVEGPFTEGTVTQMPVRVGVGLGFGSWGHSRFHSGYIGNDIILADAVELREFYRKNLFLRAKNKQGEPLWEIRAVNSSSTSDMRAVFPYLVTAASKYVGKNSGAVITVEVPRELTYQN